jgi:hypothetical protein
VAATATPLARLLDCSGCLQAAVGWERARGRLPTADGSVHILAQKLPEAQQNGSATSRLPASAWLPVEDAVWSRPRPADPALLPVDDQEAEPGRDVWWAARCESSHGHGRSGMSPADRAPRRWGSIVAWRHGVLIEPFFAGTPKTSVAVKSEAVLAASSGCFASQSREGGSAYSLSAYDTLCRQLNPAEPNTSSVCVTDNRNCHERQASHHTVDPLAFRSDECRGDRPGHRRYKKGRSWYLGIRAKLAQVLRSA